VGFDFRKTGNEVIYLRIPTRQAKATQPSRGCRISASLLGRIWFASGSLSLRCFFGRSSVVVRSYRERRNTEQAPKNDRTACVHATCEERAGSDQEVNRPPILACAVAPNLAFPRSRTATTMNGGCMAGSCTAIGKWIGGSKASVTMPV